MQWHKLSDEKPPKEGSYIIYAPCADPKKPFIHLAWWNPELQRWEMLVEYWAKAITHWMPKPKPPQDK